MMTKGVYLDVDEELTTIIEKIKNDPAVRVVLVVPKRAHVLQSIVNLKILARQAASLEKELVIATEDDNGRNLARRAGILVQRSESSPSEEPVAEGVAADAEPPSGTESAPLEVDEKEPVGESKSSFQSIIAKMKPQDTDQEEVPEEPPAEKKSSTGKRGRNRRIMLLPKVSIRLIIFFIVIGVFLVGIILFLILPQARITIQPKVQPASQDLEVVVYSEIDQLDLANSIIPGEIVTVEKEGQKEFTTTGTSQVGNKARGSVTLYNEYSSDPQPLVAGTRLVDGQGHVYRLVQGATIPGAAIIGGDTSPGTVEATAEADLAGETYNIEPSRFTLPGLPPDKQGQIYGQSSGSFNGGSSREVKVLTDEDIAKAVTELTRDLEEEALTSLKEKTATGQVLLDEAKAATIENQQTNIAVGDEADNFTLTLDLLIKAMVFSQEDMTEVAVHEIEEAVTEDKYLVGEADTDLNYELADLNFETNKLILAVNADKKAAFRIDEQVLKESIAGRSQSGAEEHLASLETIENAAVNLWPFWVKKVPKDPGKVKIDIDTESNI